MTDKEILENNKLIAEFMFPYDKYRETYWFEDRLGEFIPHGTYMIDDMYFDKSWDWLMPVVEKIQSLYETETEFGVLIDISTVVIRIRYLGFHYIDGKPQKDWKPFDIDRVYKAVVEFIKWYNNNK